MNSAMSDARKTAARPTSSGLHRRPSGVRSTMPAHCASRSMPCGAPAFTNSTAPSVIAAPGHTALTRIPCGANSMASERGESGDGVLGGGVVRQPLRRGDLGVDRCDVDDDPRPAGPHAAGRGPCAQEAARDVDVDDPGELTRGASRWPDSWRTRLRCSPGRPPVRPGIRRRRTNSATDASSETSTRRPPQGARGLCRDPGGRRPGGGLVDVGHGDGRPRFGQPPGDRGPEPLGGAGDDRAATLQGTIGPVAESWKLALEQRPGT